MTLALHDAGLCVLPADPVAKFTTLSTWKPFQASRPTREQVEAWARSARGWCLITGNVSGGLEVIDFDFRAELFEAWQKIVESEAPGLVARLVIERSQSGGKHAFYRSTGIPGNAKLASRVWATKDEHEIEYCGKRLKPSRKGDRWVATACLIETRGQGGLLLCAPTPGYAVEQGDLCDVPTITRRERDILIEAARSLNEAAPEPTYTPAATASADSPGSDFDRRGDVRSLLQTHGWTPCGGAPNERWRRPGKNSGCSATLREINGVLVFYCFSSNADPFDDGRSYTPFGVYAMLEHGGDFRRAKAALQDLGYGSPPPVVRGVGEEEEEEPAVVQVPEPDPLPVEMFRIPGFISDVMDYCLEFAPHPNRPLAFAGALALQAFLAGRVVRDSNDTRTNLYLLALANPSTGKDFGRKVNARILQECGLGHCVGDSFASAEGLEDALHATPSALFQVDEIDGMLQAINKARDVRYENIMGLLLKLYTESSGTHNMRRRAGGDTPPPIVAPSLVLFGTAVPAHYYSALSERMLTNGFFARTLVIESEQRSRGRRIRASEVPHHIIEVAKWWAKYLPPGNNLGGLGGACPVPTTVPETPQAFDVLSQASDLCDDEYKKCEEKEDTAGMTVWGRVAEQINKLSLIYAVSKNYRSPEISEDGANWATKFVMHQAARMLWMANEHSVESPTEKVRNSCLRKLRKAGAAGVLHGDLLKHSRLDAKPFGELIRTLLERREIVEIVTPRPSGSGWPIRHYRIASF